MRYVASALLLAVPFALANELPNAVDLKAAYCVTIVKWSLGNLRNAHSRGDAKVREVLQPKLSEEEAILRRLELYLTPRVPGLDPAALAAATKSGREDTVRAEQRVKECEDRCGVKQGQAAQVECAQKHCTYDDLAARFGRCQTVSWLPS